jgi:hypothetical protein
MHTNKAPIVMAEIIRDPINVMKITIMETRARPPRVSLSEKVRLKMVATRRESDDGGVVYTKVG